jgi:hypothetical protein
MEHEIHKVVRVRAITSVSDLHQFYADPDPAL